MTISGGLIGLAIFAVLCQCQDATFEGINTGEAFHALRFVGGGVQLQTANNQLRTLSSELQRTFCFETWAMLPHQANNGKYKTIVSRWQRGPTGFHNRWSDWDFQVQASGDINFFMGSGGISDYGILLSPGRTLNAGQWHHIGFSIETKDGEMNPFRTTVFVDKEEFVREGWIAGQRQELPQSPIWIGTYFNQDGDFKIFTGYLDEMRFWNQKCNLDTFISNSQIVLPWTTPNLLAYYRFNDGGGTLVRAEGKPQFDGRIDDNGAGTIAQWRVAGEKINVLITDIGPGSLKTIRLPGIEPPPGGQLTFQYWIATLPQNGTLSADGQIITRVPFRVAGNTVVYQSPNQISATDEFEYYGTDKNGVKEKPGNTIVFLQVGTTPCQRDACGQCNGDNSTCTCQPLPYNGLSLADIERLLLLFEIEQVTDLLTKLDAKFDEMLKLIQKADAVNMGVYVNEILDFNTECLQRFCNNVDPFMDRLAAIGP